VAEQAHLLGRLLSGGVGGGKGQFSDAEQVSIAAKAEIDQLIKTLWSGKAAEAGMTPDALIDQLQHSTSAELDELRAEMRTKFDEALTALQVR
jgi:hypothetical protein